MENFSNSLTEIVAREIRRDVDKQCDILEYLNINKFLKVISALYARTGIELNVNTPYHYNSISEISAAYRGETAPASPKIITLRPGNASPPVIFFAGGVSCMLELKDLIAGLSYSGPVLGIRLEDFGHETATVDEEIAACVKAIDAYGLREPFSLIGYSFGGVFALELSRALAARGQRVKLLCMIDTPIAENAWPLKVWLNFYAGRLGNRLRKRRKQSVARAPDNGQSAPAEKEPRGRGMLDRLLFRFRDPLSPNYPEKAPQWVGNYPPDYNRAVRLLLRMKGRYRPRQFDHPLHFVRAAGGSPVDCDPRAIWARYLPKANWIDQRGNHQSIIVGSNGRHLGGRISELLNKA